MNLPGFGTTDDTSKHVEKHGYGGPVPWIWGGEVQNVEGQQEAKNIFKLFFFF